MLPRTHVFRRVDSGESRDRPDRRSAGLAPGISSGLLLQVNNTPENRGPVLARRPTYTAPSGARGTAAGRRPRPARSLVRPPLGQMGRPQTVHEAPLHSISKRNLAARSPFASRVIAAGTAPRGIVVHAHGPDLRRRLPQQFCNRPARIRVIRSPSKTRAARPGSAPWPNQSFAAPSARLNEAVLITGRGAGPTRRERAAQRRRRLDYVPCTSRRYHIMRRVLLERLGEAAPAVDH